MSKHLRRWAASAALILATTATAAAEEDRTCLWNTLPIVERLRLELAARTEEGLPASVVRRLGAQGLLEVLARCGFEPGERQIAVMARYWMARAAVEVAEVELRLAGVAPGRADEALLATAPVEQRPDLAVEIMTEKDELAGPSIRAVVESLDIAGPPLSEEQKQVLAEYLSARLISDGLEGGAEPPVEGLGDIGAIPQ